MPVAILRSVADSFASCQTMAPVAPPLSPDLARVQHEAYRATLEDGGFATVVLPADEAHPDGQFTEDVAIVIGDRALLAVPGHPSRRGEVSVVAEELAGHLEEVVEMEPPATMDGGDVLQVGGKVFVGLSSRTNEAGVAAVLDFAARAGIPGRVVPVRGALHLKSVVTALDDETLLAGPQPIERTAFDGLRLLEIPDTDPAAACVIRLPDGRILAAAHAEHAIQAITDHGLAAAAVDVSEFARADGGPTCLSIRLRDV